MNIKNLYFEWLYGLVENGKPFYRLLRHLHDTDFYYILPMDANRFDDGIELRYRFSYESGISQSQIAEELDRYPCSVLEMMIALSMRCEENIMSNPEEGDRTGKWFWMMISNLGLSKMTDNNYDSDYVSNIIFNFLERDYDKNGKGGLFVIKHPLDDMHKTEIWYQLMWFLNENQQEEFEIEV